MQRKCDCGSAAINSPGHSEWCSSLKPEVQDFYGLSETEHLQKLWEEDMIAHGLLPLPVGTGKQGDDK